MDQVCTVGLDIAKNLFQVHGVDESGAVARISARHGSPVRIPATPPRNPPPASAIAVGIGPLRKDSPC